MTVRELIIRFASGLPLDAGKTPQYEGDTDLPDIEKMDLIERNNYYQELAHQRQQVEDRIKDARIKAEQMKMEEVVQERISKRVKEVEDRILEKWRQENTPSPKQNL